MKHFTFSAMNNSRFSSALRLALGVGALACASHLPAQMIPDALALLGPASGPGPWSEASLGSGAKFGQAVALDGDTLVVGAPSDFSIGTAFVYRRANGVWSLEQQLNPPAGEGLLFGWSVDIDGDTLVVGAFGWSDINGRIYIFEREGTTWTQVARRTATAGADWFGDTVAISGDLVVAGHIADTMHRGAVHTFARDEGGPDNWGETVKLMAHDGATSDEFGASIALSGDTLVVGAPGDDDKGSDSGSAYVYRREANAWQLEGKLVMASGNANERLGRRVAFEGDLQAAATGGYDSSRDNVYLWRRSGSNWSAVQGLRAAGGISGLALSGNALVAGSYWAPDGAVSLFIEVGGSWSLARTLLHPGVFSEFAAAVDDDTLVIGDSEGYAPGTTVNTGTVEVWAVDYANTAVLAGYVQKHLDHQAADGSSAFPKEKAAFRYKDLLYAEDAGLIFPDYTLMAGLWGPAELQRSRDAEALLHKFISRLKAPAYGNLLLDIYYDRAAATTILAKDQVALAEQDRLGPPLGRVPPASGFVIDNEIERHTEAQDQIRDALGLYFEVFNLPLTVPGTGPDDPATVDHTFGYDLFRDLVPNRHLAPATVIVNGQPQSVTGDDTPLFHGYRDLVMLYDLLKDYGRNARQLAWLHWANGNDATAWTLASAAQRYLLVNGSLLEGIFPDLDPTTQTASGLDTAVAGYRATVGDLAALVAQIDGNSTPLGFDRNFLMLVQKFQGQDPGLFDSFNSIKDWLNPTALTSQLRFARDRQTAALASYSSFRQNFDAVQEQYEQSTVSFEFRLFQIVGARPGEPAYETPQSNEGGEIWQQLQSLELARLRILRNQTEIDNLHEEISIETNRAANVQKVVINYGNRQAKLTEEIGYLRAAQAAAQAFADMFSIEKLNPNNLFFNAVDAGMQTGGELAISQKEAQKERLAAAEKAQIEGLDSVARVRTLWLGMRTLVLDSQEARILMKQEVGRLAQLLREKNELERRIRERDANIARRYYADPIHRLNSNYDILVANLAFDAAHQWLFFMARALQYKWNVPFTHSHGGVNWHARAVFQCRNGGELYGLYLAMLDFDAQIEGTRIKDDFFDWFSVRDDFFGYRQFDDQGQPRAYLDAVTGETVSGIEMFRRRLKRDFLDGQGQIRLRFSTVRQIPGGSFFRGARFLPNGQVDPAQRGLYLDKIRWMKIRLPGNHTTFNNVINGSLTYGGTSFIRNEQPGTIDPTRADRVVNEFTEYSTRFWYRVGQQTETLPGVSNLPDVWRFREALSWPSAQMRKDSGPRQEGSAQNPDVLPSVLQIDAFRERSVAATDWQMIIPTTDLGTPILNIDQLDDVEIYFYHYAVGRP